MLVGWQLFCTHLTFDIPNEKSTHHEIFIDLYAMQAINQDWWERDSTETAAVALGAGAGIDYVYDWGRGEAQKHNNTRNTRSLCKEKEEHTQLTHTGRTQGGKGSAK